MIQEEKQLLLQDICTRLPCGVKVWYKYGTWYPEKFATSIRLADEKIALSHKFNKEGDWFPVEEAGEILIKPYLRPMSSMTEEEKKEYIECACYEIEESVNGRHYEYYLKDFCGTTDNPLVNTDGVDWLNAHHFDYRGLIEKNLALDCTGLHIYD